MKTAIRLFLLLFALYMSNGDVVAQAPSISLPVITAMNVGQLINIPVSAGAFSGVNAISLSLSYPKNSLQFVSMDNGQLTEAMVNDLGGNTRISWYDINTPISFTGGVLFTLTYKYTGGGNIILKWDNVGQACWWSGPSFSEKGGYSNGEVRPAIVINGLTWSLYNENVGTKALTQTNNGIVEKFCYDGKETNCDVYGGLYQWAEAMQYQGNVTNTTHWTNVPTNVQGICPQGWHIPTNEEWTSLVNSLGGDLQAGGKIKETGTLHWQGPYGAMGMKMNTGATNSSGFTALPGGWWNNVTGKYEKLLQYGEYWTITKGQRESAAYWWGANYNGAQIIRGETTKTGGYSVRCVMNSSPVDTTPIVPSYGNLPVLIAPKMASTTSVINVPINVKNFIGITEGDLYFDFNPNLLSVANITMNIQHTGLTYTINPTSANIKFTCSSPISLSDGTTLFTIQFNKKAVGVSVVAWEPQCKWNVTQTAEPQNYIDGAINIQ